ncbi:hypothetical protein K2X30_13380 [bacterium]|nr:hypothetical protein [bacterium]
MRSHASALRTQLSQGVAALRLADRFYEKGQSWEVELWSTSSDAMARMESASSASTAMRDKPFRFAFKVIDVGASQVAEIEVRPVSQGGQTIEPRIDHVVLKINSDRTIIQKNVYYKDGRPPVAFLGGNESNLSLGFDGYPLVLPDLKSIDGKPITEAPRDLPNGARLNATRGLDFRFHDAYAREIRVIWEDGAPWPAYVKTPAGVAIVRGDHP